MFILSEEAEFTDDYAGMSASDNDIINPDLVQNTNEKYSYKFLVMIHLMKLNTIASKEFAGGYMKKIFNETGRSVHEEYVPDTREEYCNSVEQLYILLSPNFTKDEEEAAKVLTNAFESLKREFTERQKTGNESGEKLLHSFKIAKTENKKKLLQLLTNHMVKGGFLGSKRIIDE